MACAAMQCSPQPTVGGPHAENTVQALVAVSISSPTDRALARLAAPSPSSVPCGVSATAYECVSSVKNTPGPPTGSLLAHEAREALPAQGLLGRPSREAGAPRPTAGLLRTPLLRLSSAAPAPPRWLWVALWAELLLRCW